MKNKYFISLPIIITMGLILFSACQKPVTDVTLNKSKLFLKPNKSEVLIATVHPKNATNKEVTWKSSNHRVAIVNSGGTVTACSYGDAIITATTIDGNKIATCFVVVSDLVGEDDYRANWVGSYDCEKVRANYPIVSYLIVDVAAKGDSVLYISEREISISGDQTVVRHDVKINSDGYFRGGERPYVIGNFYADSLYIKLTNWSAGATSVFIYKGKKQGL